MPEPEKTYAPFSIEQARNLNHYQVSGAMHPFTCPHRGDGAHGVLDDGVLLALKAGWVCVECDYSQNWAWGWMADGRWQTWQAEIADL